MRGRDCLDEQREPREEEEEEDEQQQRYAATGERDKTRSKEEGVTEGSVVGKKCEVTGEVGEMEENERKRLKGRHTDTQAVGTSTTEHTHVPYSQSQGRIGRPIQTGTRAGKT